MADLNSNTLTNIDRICYCAGIRTCSLGCIVDGGTLFHKGGNRALVYCMRRNNFCYGAPVSANWYDTCTWVLGLGTGWFFPTINESIFIYSCTDIRTTFCHCFWSEERNSGSAHSFRMGCAIRFDSSNKSFFCNYGIAVKSVYY